MKIRSSRISASILKAVSFGETDPSKQNISRSRRILRIVLSFFSFFKLLLARYRGPDFQSLRKDVWRLDEKEYTESFNDQVQAPPTGNEGPGEQPQNTRKGKGKMRMELSPIGDLGYSGSTFFTTPNGKFLIKSLPRRFEHEFFTHDLFDNYVAHMRDHPHSLLVRITDMVYTPHATLGGIVGTAPTHHIIMENLLYGRDTDNDWRRMKWETYDLKPSDYFFPERDIADGRLAPESVKDKLIDEFPDRIRVSAQAKKELLNLLEADTQLLSNNNAIDYSLFLVRYPGPNSSGEGDDDTPPEPVPFVASDATAWRTGMQDADGKWVYRVIVLDFFWARHKFRARAMTSLVKTFNKLAHKGPMSITANPIEYRTRFMDMIRQLVVEV